MIFKRRKPFVEAVEVTLYNLENVRSFIGEDRKIMFYTDGWFIIQHSKGDLETFTIKDGDFIVKGSDSFYAVDRQDFHDLYVEANM